MKYAYLFGFIVGMLVLLSSGSGLVLAEDTKLKVQILPEDCLFDIVNDGSNSIVYLTPAECGQTVPGPVDPPELKPEQKSQEQLLSPLSPRPRANTYVFPSPRQQPERTSIPLPELYLNSFGEYAQSGKYLQFTSGQKVYFGVDVLGVFEMHSVIVRTIGDGYVDITVASTPQNARILLGESRRFDVTGDGQDEIQITLNTITDGFAGMTFLKLDPSSRSDVDNVVIPGNRGKSPFIAVIIFVLLCGVLPRYRYK